MLKWQKGPIAVAALTAALLVTLVAPASAAPEAPNRQVSGIAYLGVEGCPGLRLMPSSDGWSLDGCLVLTSITQEKWNPSGTYQERGTEEVEAEAYYNGAAVAGSHGTFTTTYLFVAKFAVPGDLGTQEIHGFCQHPITGGEDGFAGVTGRLDFKDDVEAGNFPYRGHLKLPALQG